MKKILFIFLVTIVSIQSKSQEPTLKDEFKSQSKDAAKDVIDGLFDRARQGIDSIATRKTNEYRKKKIDERNRNKCPDTLECKLDSIANVIITVARKKNISPIAVWEFTDTVTNYGKKMAEMLSIALSSVDDSIKIVERLQIDKIMKEQGLSSDGLTDPSTAIRIGHLLKADAIITGSIRIRNNITYMDIKMIDTETGVILWARTINYPMQEKYNQKQTIIANSQTNNSNSGYYYPLPPGYYLIPGASNIYCLDNKQGSLVVKNLTGKDIMIFFDNYYRFNGFERKVLAGQVLEIPLYQGVYSIRILIAGNNIEINKGEIIIHTCEKIGMDVNNR